MNSMSMLFVSRLQKFSPHSKEDQSKVSRLVLNFVKTKYALRNETFKWALSLPFFLILSLLKKYRGWRKTFPLSCVSYCEYTLNIDMNTKIGVIIWVSSCLLHLTNTKWLAHEIPWNIMDNQISTFVSDRHFQFCLFLSQTEISLD